MRVVLAGRVFCGDLYVGYLDAQLHPDFRHRALGAKHQHLRAVRAFKLGLSPVVISMMVAAGWLLATANTDGVRDWPLWLVAAMSAVIVYRTKVHMLLLLAIGAVLGASGLLVVG